MPRSNRSVYRMFRDFEQAEGAKHYRKKTQPHLGQPHSPETNVPTVPLLPHHRCVCGQCRECRENAKWDRIFKKFESTVREERGMFQCSLNDI